MALSRAVFRSRYRKLAPIYDAGMWLYRGLGMRISDYRKDAVVALRLEAGDSVVDLGCGTGLNFEYLQAAVGPTGRIIGVDLTDAMLSQARKRVDRYGWKNVELIESDMMAYDIPAETDGVLATLALSTVPDYEQVVANVARNLRCGARIANFELQWPERWPVWLANLGAWLNRPAGVTPDIYDRLPAQAIKRYFVDVDYREVYFGAGYICAGRAAAKETHHVS